MGFAISLLIAFAATTRADPNAAEAVARLKDNYQQTVLRISTRAEQAVESLRKEYLARLDEIEMRLEEQGDLSGVLAVRAERDRFHASGQFAVPSEAGGPTAFKKAAENFVERNRLLEAERVRRLAAAAQSYYQQLSVLEKRLRTEGDLAGAALVRTEKDALLSDPAIREAIQKSQILAGPNQAAQETPPVPDAIPTTPTSMVGLATAPMAGASAPTQATFAIYKPGKEPPVPAKDSMSLRLSFPSAAARAADINYTLSATLITVRDRLQTRKEVSALWNVKSEEGILSYVPRITLTARNRPIEEGATLVIEYFSRLVGESDRQKECVEVIPLPPLPVGQSVVVDARGIDLYKYAYRANWGTSGSKREAGRELYGIIVGVYDANGKPLIQQVSKSGLEDMVSSQAPAAKPCPPPRPGVP